MSFVFDDVLHSAEATRCVDVFEGKERSAHDLLCCHDYSGVTSCQFSFSGRATLRCSRSGCSLWRIGIRLSAAFC